MYLLETDTSTYTLSDNVIDRAAVFSMEQACVDVGQEEENGQEN